MRAYRVCKGAKLAQNTTKGMNHARAKTFYSPDRVMLAPGYHHKQTIERSEVVSKQKKCVSVHEVCVDMYVCGMNAAWNMRLQ